MRKLGDTDVLNKTIALRVDLNVPVKDGKVLDDTRILAAIPTLKYLQKQNSKTVLISHFGRPQAGVIESKFSLLPVAQRLGEILNKEIPLFASLDDVNFHKDISMIENIRFLPGELNNNLELSRTLSNLADVYVFDAFGTSHRSHASTYGAIHAAHSSCSGFLLEDEISALKKATESMNSPTLSIVGGSKVSSKLEVIKNLLQISDEVLTGGGITNTFLKAQGNNIGISLCEDSMLSEAKELFESDKILLPDEVVVGKGIDSSESRICKIDSVQDDEMILDQVLSSSIAKKISLAKKIIWNGPVGVFEKDLFSRGTHDLANAIASSKAYSLAGGGETLLAIKMFIDKSNVSYCSTGGGAFLEFMEGKELPSLSALGFKF
ncbi:MAG: phosphoglycerate kinase [SAR86 cluster bacterium]|uniref:Phosphoglycerate kinase n=1 Tax=SAR86 cluster bacterium TaxID=2030880 RepID=A0A368BJC0_9GAMM|nr:MAG: phosphoglycerate kinase [SAR86 cluster bacterium]